ncbi:MAG TPA: hypothetical protein VF483_09600 [Gemmatimonadaceae bacterium]
MEGSTKPLKVALLGALLVASACSDTATRGPAAIYVAVESRSDEPLSFNYGVSVDAGQASELAFGRARFTIPNLTPGTHVVSTSNLPAFCSGGEPRQVTLGGGDTVTVAINIACSRVSSDLSVQVATGGATFDPDGYDVFLDQNKIGHVHDGLTQFRYQPVGSHVVSLSGVSGSCVASAPVPVQLTVGTLGSASFTVSCAATGIVRVVSTFTGSDVDPDGAVAMLDGGLPVRGPPSINAAVRVPVGSHSFTIADIAPNCTATTPLSGAVTVASRDTTFIRVAGTCSLIGMGTASLVVPDPIGDTLEKTTTDNAPAFDLSSVTVRGAKGWLILVLHFANAQNGVALKSLFGNVDIDTDEITLTGSAPLSNLFGGHASQGADYSILFTGDDKTAGVVQAGAARDSLSRVRLVSAGDSVTMLVPLNKLGNDDGNATATILVGLRQRPTDLAPNDGVVTIRPKP